MLNINNLNVYFDGFSKNEEESIATFHSNYDGEESVHFSVNAGNISKLNENIDICIEDFKEFIKEVLKTATKEKIN